ncbi:cupin domain-containing protein [Kitasatospora terrestris]|uniref:Cupin type-2 domain-containing protein n=1 Tax=Kitasatospora terrestris TaxID=258051 RepID=A0ABP9E5N9_9ACTN
MLIRPMTEHELTDAYGIRYQQLYPHGGEDLAPWGFGRAVVEPGGATEPHQHEENEVFVFLEGSGEITIGEERAPVHPDLSVFIPGGSRHQVTNASSDQRLVFLSIYWPESHGPVSL